MMKIFLLLLIFFITSCTTPIGGAKKVDDIKPQETPSIESIEAGLWMQKNKFKSIRLVTAAYHMPRSLREFSLISPTIVVVPHPGFPSNVHLKSWWMWSGSASLLVSEYLKTLFIYLRTFLDALDLVQ